MHLNSICERDNVRDRGRERDGDREWDRMRDKGTHTQWHTHRGIETQKHTHTHTHHTHTHTQIEGWTERDSVGDGDRETERQGWKQRQRERGQRQRALTSPLRSVCEAVSCLSWARDRVETSGEEPPVLDSRKSSFKRASDWKKSKFTCYKNTVWCVCVCVCVCVRACVRACVRVRQERKLTIPSGVFTVTN